jgi:peptide/nickel transport system substrate-binding protein
MLEPPNPSIEYSNYTSLWWLQFMQETPTYGDIMTGPRGTNEWAWQTWFYVPPSYMIGCLTESWEITHEELVFHVKPGIYWAPTEHQSTFMEARELTADDIAQDITRFWKSAWGARFKGMIADVYTTDRYTVVVEFENYSSALLYYIGYEDRSLIQAPETAAVGPDKYENQVGTGPFMFEEYVIGSYMSFKRNPNYWGTTTINGVEYQLP